VSGAILALAGVVVGALASGGTTWVLDRRRERRRALGAARLVYAEMLHAGATCVEVLARADGEAVPRIEVTNDRWLAHELAIASATTTFEWFMLVNANSAVEALKKISSDQPRGTMTPPLRQEIQHWQDLIEGGLHELRRHVGYAQGWIGHYRLRRRSKKSELPPPH
jgi:hypothetical protein